jgi:hypothetical protein
VQICRNDEFRCRAPSGTSSSNSHNNIDEVPVSFDSLIMPANTWSCESCLNVAAVDDSGTFIPAVRPVSPLRYQPSDNSQCGLFVKFQLQNNYAQKCLTNSLILIIGDSVDGNMFAEVCHRMLQGTVVVNYPLLDYKSCTSSSPVTLIFTHSNVWQLRRVILSPVR